MKKIAIIGSGVVGMSVAAEIGDRAEITLYDPAPGGGASHGSSRIFRHSHDDLAQVELSRRAALLWREWEKEAHRSLVLRSGLLTVGAKAAERREHLAEAEVTHRWRQVGKISSTGLGFDSGLWEPGAGVIWSEQVMFSLRDRIADSGVEQVPETVFSVEEKDGAALVWSRSGSRTFDRVLIVPGPGLGQLLPEWSRAIGLDFENHLRLEFPVRGPENPVEAFIDRDAGVYGLPCPGFRRYAIGLDCPNLGLSEKSLISYVNRRLHRLDPEPSGASVCFRISVEGKGDKWALLEDGPVLAFAGGNLFKWAPLLGAELGSRLLDGSGDPRFADLCLTG